VIIARSPLRISLGGGGTDLPSYYREHGGFLIAGAIDKYVYVTAHTPFTTGITLRYSSQEKVSSRSDIQHPLIRAAFAHLGVKGPLEMTTMADIPAGTGLGSSGSFATALLKAMHRHLNRTIDQRELAELACRLEIDVLNEPVGKQDQYVAAYGGVNCYEFRSDGRVVVSPLAISDDTLRHFYQEVLLFSTGITRAAPAILREQDDKTRAQSAAMIDNLHEVKRLGYESKQALEAGDLTAFGKLMHLHWERKKKRSALMSNSDVDGWYAAAMDAGATGGKLIGAGGGGFLMFHTRQPVSLRAAMEKIGLGEMRYTFDYSGTTLL
jgi:D-glycero-alpha-D-manno-heptose-7-phosphate kinase